MKRILIAAIVLGLLCGAAGCNGVMLSATYSNLLDTTATLSDETAKQAEAGTLTPEEMTQALRGQAKVWRRFQDARDGKGDQ